MDDDRPDTAAEGGMRQSLGLSVEAMPPAAGDPQRSARHAIRSQAAARDYAERQLARAEQTIQELHAKFHAVRREKAIAVEAARSAYDAQTQAERGRRAAEAALINEKAIGNSAQREAREARAIIQDLRTKLAQANQTAHTLQTRLENGHQASIAAEEAQSTTPVPAAASEMADAPVDRAVKRKRGRPPGRRDAAAPRPAPKTRKSYADQQPVRWWADGWTPSA